MFHVKHFDMPTYKNYFTKILTYDGIMNSALINCSAGSVVGSDFKRNYSDIENIYHYIPGAFTIPDERIATEIEYLVTTLSNGKDLYYKHGSNNHPSLYTYDDNQNMVYFWDAYINLSTRHNLTFIIVHSDDATGSFGEYGVYVYSQYQNSDFFMMWNVSATNAPQWHYLLDGVPVNVDDPYIISPETGEGGGYGDFDYSSDDTDFSRLPTLSASDVGFCTLFEVAPSDVKSLASYLWGLGSLASFLPIFSDPMECILSLGIVPVAPATGERDLIKVGNLTTTVYGNKISAQFGRFDCGSLELDGQSFTKSFMDYSPYTKAELFLPYIGTVSLDIDEIMDASALHLQYQYDLLSGACIAELKVTKAYNYKNADHVHENVLYRYSGNILSNVPITGANYTQMYQAIVSAVATGIGGAAGAETAKTAAGAAAIEDKATLSNIASSSSMKQGIKRAGNATANCGYLGGQKPELILSLPKLAHLGEAQGKEFGFPRYGEYTLSDLRGYTKIIQVHLKNVKCTDTERNLIQQALNAGVVVSGTATPTQTQTAGTVKVYSYSCEKIALNKADNWELLDTITGNWRSDSIDVLKPEIAIKATNALTQAKILKEANYVYIADFNRYYYITGIKAGNGNIITLNLDVDAPMSWLDNIKTEKVVVDRQEKSWNTYLSDGFIKTYNTPYTVVKQFPNGFTASKFILAVAGG